MSKADIKQLCGEIKSKIKFYKPYIYYSVPGIVNVADDFSEFLNQCQTNENNVPVEIVLTALYFLKQSLMLEGIDYTFLSSSPAPKITYLAIELIMKIFKKINFSYRNFYEIYQILKIFSEHCSRCEINFSTAASHPPMASAFFHTTMQDWWSYLIADGLLSIFVNFKIPTEDHEISILIYLTSELFKLRESPTWTKIRLNKMQESDLPIWTDSELNTIYPTLKYFIGISDSLTNSKQYRAIRLITSKFNFYYHQSDSKRNALLRNLDPAQNYLMLQDDEISSVNRLVGYISSFMSSLKIFPAELIGIVLKYFSEQSYTENTSTLKPAKKISKADYFQETDISIPAEEIIEVKHIENNIQLRMQNLEILPILLPQQQIVRIIIHYMFNFRLESSMIARFFKTMHNFPAFQIQMSWLDNDSQIAILSYAYNNKTLINSAVNPDVKDWIENKLSWRRNFFCHNETAEIERKFHQNRGRFNSLVNAVKQNYPLPTIKNFLSMLPVVNQGIMLSKENQLLIRSAQGETRAFLNREYDNLLSKSR